MCIRDRDRGLVLERLSRHGPPSESHRGDDDQPWGRVGDDVLARQLGRLVRLAGQQRAQAGIHTLDVGLGELGGEDAVDVPEDVLDVRGGGCGVGEVEGPVGVGRPDDPVPAPRDDDCLLYTSRCV